MMTLNFEFKNYQLHKETPTLTCNDLVQKLKQKFNNTKFVSNYFFTASNDKTVKHWELAVNDEHGKFLLSQVKSFCCSHEIEGAVFDKEKDRIITCGEAKITTQTFSTEAQTFEAKEGPWSMAWWIHENKKYLITGCCTRKMQISCPITMEVLHQFPSEHEDGYYDMGRVYNLIVDQKNDQVLCCSDGNYFSLWCLKTRKLLKTYTNGCQITNACFLDSENRLIAGRGYGCAYIWSKKTGGCLRTVSTRNTQIFDGILCSVKRRTLILCTNESTLAIVNFGSGKTNKFEIGVKSYFMQFLDPIEQSRVIIGGVSGELKIFDLDKLEIIASKDKAHKDVIKVIF